MIPLIFPFKMLAPQNTAPTIFDSMAGTVSSWYEDVDNCLKLSEVIPGNYEYSDAPSYGNVGTIAEGSSTSFDISCAGTFKIISLDNSYITLQQTVDIAVPAIASSNTIAAREYYVGYKMSAMAIKSYEFLTNTDTLQSVNNVAAHESFLIYNSISDHAKENNECFATLNKVLDRNPNVPGTYINLTGNVTAHTIHVPINLKIPLTHFLLLFNLKYFPDWAGTLTLRIYTSFENIVMCPLPNPAVYALGGVQDALNGTTGAHLGFFHPQGAVVNLLSSSDGTISGNTPTIVSQTFACNTQVTNMCRIHLASYVLTADISQQLAAKYIQTPLLFPIQTLSSKDFTTPLVANGTTDTAMTVSVRHCDSMFVVFRKDNSSKTCFVNPEITYSFNIAGKYYPRGNGYDTVPDVGNTASATNSDSINLTLDALNINNSLLTSINRDLSTSLKPYYASKGFAAGAVDGTTVMMYNHGDRSNFMIGIPFCDSDDFMGGITTNGTVQIQLKADRVAGSKMSSIPFGQPVALFLQDAFLKIRAVKPSSSKQIDISNFTIEQILTSNGAI